MRHVGRLIAAAAISALVLQTQAQADCCGLSKSPKHDLSRIHYDMPSLAPMAHVVFCLKYPADCEVQHPELNAQPVELTAKRWHELQSVNAAVNRDIFPERNILGLDDELWLVSPRSGDCNDYAVTKQHKLLAKGWPSRSLALAEVATPWGEHHLVVVVRMREGDLVLDNLYADIRPWAKTSYLWVRVQLPDAPRFWATVRVPSI